jgi:spermidine/putrescine transport system permease protein
MIGNVIERLFLQTNDYPAASALGFVLMAAVLVLVAIYAKVVGAKELTA